MSVFDELGLFMNIFFLYMFLEECYTQVVHERKVVSF